MPVNLVIADCVAHAEAMIQWMRLDESYFPLAYNSKLSNFYGEIILIRPLSGLTEDHLLWLLDELQPRVAGPYRPMPDLWSFEAAIDEASIVTFA